MNQGFFVEVGTAHTQSHALKGGEVLPVLATVRHGDDAGLFQGFGGHKELVPIGRHFDAGFFERSIAGPQPVHAVHVHRSGDVVALVFHDVGNHGGQQAVPLLGLGHIVDVGQHAFSSPLLQSRAFDLRCSRGIARDHARLEHGHGVVTAATGHGEVFPGVALALQGGLQGSCRLGFATAGPVVQHFHFTGMGRHGQHSGCGQDRTLEHFQSFQESLLVGAGGPKLMCEVAQTARQRPRPANINVSLIY